MLMPQRASNSFLRFRNACHFDDGMDSAMVRRFEDMSNDEVIGLLRSQAENDKHNGE